MSVPPKKLSNYNPNAVAGDSYILAKVAEQNFFKKRFKVLVVLLIILLVTLYLRFAPSTPPSPENVVTPDAAPVVNTLPGTGAAVDQTGNEIPQYTAPTPFIVAKPPEAIALKYLRKDLPLPTPIEGLPPVPPELIEGIRDVLDRLPENATSSNLISEQDILRLSLDHKILAAALFTLLPELMTDAEFELVCTVFQRLDQSDFRVTALALYPNAKFNFRKALLRVIGSTGTPASLDWLLERVVDEQNKADGAVTRAVAYFVKKDPSSLAAIAIKLEEPAPKRLAYLQILANCGQENAVDGVIRSLLYNDPDVRMQALNNLRNMDLRGRPIPRELATLLKDEDLMVRKETIMVMASSKDFASIPLLIEGLNDKNAAVKETTHWALKQMTGKEFPAADPASWKEWWTAEAAKYATEVPKLLSALKAVDGEGREAAIKALTVYSRFLDAQAVLAIRACLRDENFLVRLQVCYFLVSTRHPDALRDLFNCLNDSHAAVKNYARSAITTLTGQRVPEDARQLAEFKRRVLEQIGKTK